MISKTDKFLNTLNKITPKGNVITFNSFPDAADNALPLYEYIIKQRPDLLDRYNLIWLAGGDPGRCREILKRRIPEINHTVYKKNSIPGLFAFMRSKLVFNTHGGFDQINMHGAQKRVLLWHGMPLKKIGNYEEPNRYCKEKSEYTIATSECFRKIMAKAMGVPEENAFVTGYPRNDLLLANNDALQRLNIDKTEYDKIFCWLPTYRKAVIGDIRTDGAEGSFGAVDVLKNHIEELEAKLTENNYLLLIKPHPMDIICRMELPYSDHVRVLGNDEISEAGLQIYEILGNCDVLFTDYSSVYVDFLITGKPIVFVCDDFEQYDKTRGFIFDNMRDLMPGPLLENFNQMLDYFDRVDDTASRWSDAYKKIRDYFISDKDSYSCERVCRLFLD